MVSGKSGKLGRRVNGIKGGWDLQKRWFGWILVGGLCGGMVGGDCERKVFMVPLIDLYGGAGIFSLGAGCRIRCSNDILSPCRESSASLGLFKNPWTTS